MSGSTTELEQEEQDQVGRDDDERQGARELGVETLSVVDHTGRAAADLKGEVAADRGARIALTSDLETSEVRLVRLTTRTRAELLAGGVGGEGAGVRIGDLVRVGEDQEVLVEREARIEADDGVDALDARVGSDVRDELARDQPLGAVIGPGAVTATRIGAISPSSNA